MALKVVGNVADERERWLSMMVCVVMKAGYKDDGRDYFCEGRLEDESKW